jgi:hypothetical protein
MDRIDCPAVNDAPLLFLARKANDHLEEASSVDGEPPESHWRSVLADVVKAGLLLHEITWMTLREAARLRGAASCHAQPILFQPSRYR